MDSFPGGYLLQSTGERRISEASTVFVGFFVAQGRPPVGVLGGWAPRTDGSVVSNSLIYFSHEVRPFGRGPTTRMFMGTTTITMGQLTTEPNPGSPSSKLGVVVVNPNWISHPSA